MLAIEIDGDTHDNEEVMVKDKQRQKHLESYGVTFIHFSDKEVKHNPEKIGEYIKDWIELNLK